MKISEKLKNKHILMALAGLVGLGALFVAPASEAGIWIRVNPAPAYFSPGPFVRPGYRHRHVVVHRQCHVNRWGYRRCYVQRHVWVN